MAREAITSTVTPLSSGTQMNGPNSTPWLQPEDPGQELGGAGPVLGGEDDVVEGDGGGHGDGSLRGGGRRGGRHDVVRLSWMPAIVHRSPSRTNTWLMRKSPFDGVPL